MFITGPHVILSVIVLFINSLSLTSRLTHRHSLVWKRELKPLNIFSLQSWTRWSFVRRGYWGMLKEKGVFLFMGLVCSPCQAPAVSTPSPESFPGTLSVRKLPSQTSQGKHLPVDGFPWYLLGPLCSQHIPLVLPWVLCLRYPQVVTPY